jgi:hypothetical protein
MNLTRDSLGFTSTPLRLCTPIETTVNAVESNLDFHWHVYDLAQDCVNRAASRTWS